MNNKILEEVKKVCKNNGWSIFEYDDFWDIRKYSPAGEDFGFSVEKENIIENIVNYAYDFDVDEHVKMLVENMDTVRGVPQSVRTLVYDADDIADMLKDLAGEAINEAQPQNEQIPLEDIENYLNNKV